VVQLPKVAGGRLELPKTDKTATNHKEKSLMAQRHARRPIAALFAACVAIVLGAVSPARASVISTTATLPVLGVPYTSSTGVGCFPIAAVCVGQGTFVLTSVVSSTFNPSGQVIVTNVAYAGTLTTLGNAPIGPVSLKGTMEQEVLGRSGSTQLGIWATEIVALSLSGPLLGHTLSLSLDGSAPSVGSTSITPLSDDLFRIDSFFDVFVELTLDSSPPLHATRGPVHVSAGAVPEPSSLALLAGGLATLAAWCRRTKTPR
jgi:hypothetical protein